MADALDSATEKLLENNKSPQRRLGAIDNRGSHFYLAMYWAEALANQSSDADLSNQFKSLAEALIQNESAIVEELNAVQGSPVNIGGYYRPDESLVSNAMRPSKTLNSLLGSLKQGSN